MRKTIFVFASLIAVVLGSLTFAAPANAANPPGSTGSCPTTCIGVPINGAGGVDTSGGTGGGGSGVGVGSGGGKGGGTVVTSGYWLFSACNNYTVYPLTPTTCTVHTFTRFSYLTNGTVLGGAIGMTTVCPPGSTGTALGVERWYQNIIAGTRITVEGGNLYCVYPAAKPSPIVLATKTCTWAYNATLYYSTDHAAINTGGTYQSTRGPQPGDPAAPSQSGSGAPSGCYTGPINTLWNAPISNYGFYAARTTYDSKKYTLYGYPAWTHITTQFWSAGGTVANNKNYYFIYSCPSALEGAYTPYSALPAQGARIFNPALCPSTHWQCVLTGTLDVAGTHGAVSLIRNGKNVPVKYPSVTVTGTGFTGVTDATTQYMTTVKSGSTPYNPAASDPNATNQYFKLLKSDGTTNELFNTWYNSPNANTQKNIQYYWASNPGAPFYLQDTIQINGQFLVPVVNSLNGGVSMQYKQGTATCPNTPVTSNAVTILRSVNN
jgi:hypothetical protein